jgi:uncharacterized protein YecT (DUF1311 family)
MSHHLPKAALVVSALFWASVGNADAGYDTCMETADTSYDMSVCGGKWRERSEAALAKAWRAAMDAVGGKGSDAGKDLLLEQRAWIKFKDQSCKFYYAKGFGSMHRSIFAPTCHNEIIEARTKQLNDIATGLTVED